MKPSGRSSHPAHGFTLVEAVGVLAVLILLAALLIPSILGAIDDARLAADVLSIKNVRSATETYFQRYLALAGTNGADLTAWMQAHADAYEDWDRDVLVREQFLERELSSQLCTNTCVRLILAQTNLTIDPLARGTYGSLGLFYGNNGAYTLETEYAANPVSASPAQLYALGSPPGRLPGPPLGPPPVLSHAAQQEAVRMLLAWPSGLTANLLSEGGRLALRLGETLRAGRRTGWPIAPARPWIPGWRNPAQGFPLGPIEASVTFFPRRIIVDPPPSPPPSSPPPPGNPTHPESNPNPLPNDAAGPAGTITVETVLEGVSIADAYRLSLAIDGPSQSNWAYFDSRGRVKYDFGGAKTGTVFIFVAVR